MFDPRLTPVFQVGGEPYSYQDASGELAAMAVGASLWGLGPTSVGKRRDDALPTRLATKYNYTTWKLGEPDFPVGEGDRF